MTEQNEVLSEEVVEVPETDTTQISAEEVANFENKRNPKHRSMKRRRIASNTVIYVVLVLMSIIWLVPFVLIVFQSLRVTVGADGEILRNVSSDILPNDWGIDNYIYLFTETDFLKWYGNTFIVALATCVMQTLFVLLTSYGLSRFRFKGRKLLMRLMLVLGMFPGFLTMIILYWLLKQWGMAENGAIAGLIVVNFASSGMGYYVSKGYFDTIPKSLDEAARIDGATRLQVLYKIIIPMAKPIVIYTILTSFMAPWTDYIFAAYIAHGFPDGYTVAVGLYNWLDQSMISSHYTLFCAGGVVVAIPVTILFMCLQKYYVAGVTGGAVKG